MPVAWWRAASLAEVGECRSVSVQWRRARHRARARRPSRSTRRPQHPGRPARGTAHLQEWRVQLFQPERQLSEEMRYDVLHCSLPVRSRTKAESSRPGRSGPDRVWYFTTRLARRVIDIFSFEDRLCGYKSAAGSKLNLNTRGVVEDPKTPRALARTKTMDRA